MSRSVLPCRLAVSSGDGAETAAAAAGSVCAAAAPAPVCADVADACGADAAAAAAADRAKRNYNILSRAVERRVESDLQRFLTAQAAEAGQLWKAGRMSAFHKLVQTMFKGKPAAVGSSGIKSDDGNTTYRSVQEQLKRF